MQSDILEHGKYHVKSDSIVYKPAFYTWLFTLIGLFIYGLATIFALFGIAILAFENLREIFWNWAIASILSAILIGIIGRTVINFYGAKYFKVDKLSYSFKSPLGKSYLILKDDIIHIEVNQPNPKLEKLSLSSPSIIIITYDGIFNIKTRYWLNKSEIIRYFQEQSLIYHDEFAIYYHRSKRSIQKYFLRISQDTPGVIGLTIIVIYTFIALWGALAMLISPPSRYATHTLFMRNPEFGNFVLPGMEQSILTAPNSDFWFGTDFFGRDIFARVVFGTTFTFMIAIVGASISLFFILFFGLTSAFFGGWWDNLVTRVSDTLLTFPPFVVLLLISTSFNFVLELRGSVPGGYFLAVYAGMAFFTWPMGARLIRAEVIETMNTEYMLAAKQIGSSDYRLLVSHIIPKIIPTILILFSFQFTDIIIGTTLLGFIGFGSESTLTWGSDLAHSEFSSYNLNSWWTFLFPTLAIFFLVFGLTLFSDSIRDSLDPKRRGGIKAVPFEFLEEVGL